MRTTAYEDESNLYIKYEDDVEPIMEQNKRLQADRTRLFDRKSTMRRVAEIPMVIAMKFREEQGLDILNPEHANRIAKIIKTDPDYKYFRTR